MIATVRDRLGAAIGAPSLRVASLFALAGVGFAGGNLLLARALSRADYGLVALWLTVYYLGGALAPWGADGIVNRRRIPPGLRLIRRTLFSSTVTAALVVFVAGVIYPLSYEHLLLLYGGIIVCGMGTVAAAQFQARQKFQTAMAIWQGSNMVLLVAATAALVIPSTSPAVPLVVFTLGAVVISSSGWIGLRRQAAAEDIAGEPYPWSEALSYYLAASATAFLPQVERLVIPEVLSLEDLAVFGVLAALVMSPYRMLQAGVGYTLFPRLNQAGSRRERRKLMREEVWTVLIGGGGSALAVWFLAPWVTSAFLGDKYELTAALVLAGLVAGFGKLVGAVGRSAVNALASKRELAAYGAASWVALLGACFGAWFGSRWGVPGVIYGTTAGLSVRWLLALVLGLRHVIGPDRPYDVLDRGPAAMQAEG